MIQHWLPTCSLTASRDFPQPYWAGWIRPRIGNRRCDHWSYREHYRKVLWLRGKELAGLVIIILVLMIRPYGLFGQRGIERV